MVFALLRSHLWRAERLLVCRFYRKINRYGGSFLPINRAEDTLAKM
jgi:hypothetical protein